MVAVSLLCTLGFLVPAVVLADLVRGERVSRWDLLGGLGLTMSAMGWLGYAVAISFDTTYQPATVGAVAAAFLIPAWLRRRRLGAYLHALWRAGRPSLESLCVTGLIALGFLAALVIYRNEVYSNTCTHASLSVALGLPVGDEQLNAIASRGLLHLTQGEREGVYAHLAPLAALWGFLGLRLFYAVTVALGGALGYLLARRLFPGRAWVRVAATAVFLAFLPAIDILWNEVNTVTFLVTCGLLWIVLEEHAPPWLIGAVTAALVAVRHIALLAVPGPAWLVLARARRDGRTLRAALAFGVTFLVALLPMFAHHQVAYGSPFAFESFNDHEAHLHGFLGLEFSLNAMWNFPFHDTLVRTPFNALPHYLLLPVWVLSRMGLLVATLCAVGLAWLVRAHRWRLLPFALWTGPYLLALVVNENWIQIEKFGAIAVVAPFLLLGVGAGLDALVRLRSWVARGAWVAVAATALLGFWYGALAVRVPADQRFYEDYPLVPAERPEYLDLERSIVAPRLLPALRSFRVGLVPDPFGELFDTLRAPGFAHREQSAHEDYLERLMPGSFGVGVQQADVRSRTGEVREGPARRLDVSLGAPWVAGDGWLSDAVLPDGGGAPGEASAAVVLDLRDAPADKSYMKFPHPWFPDLPASLYAWQRGDVVYVVISGPHPYETFRILPDGRPVQEPRLALENPPPPGGRFSVIVPQSSTVRFVENVYLDPGRTYLWQLGPGEPATALRGPVHWRFN